MKNNLEVKFQSSLFPIEFKAFKLAHTISLSILLQIFSFERNEISYTSGLNS